MDFASEEFNYQHAPKSFEGDGVSIDKPGFEIPDGQQNDYSDEIEAILSHPITSVTSFLGCLIHLSLMKTNPKQNLVEHAGWEDSDACS